MSRTAVGSVALILLAVATFALDFLHGLAIGQDRVLFHPIYRVRQSLAIALSRLHEQPAAGYLAHKSVIDALNEHGFAIRAEDRGLHLDPQGWNSLLNDTDRLNRAVTEAVRAPLDLSLAPEIIVQNEPGYADLLYVGFKLFGTRIQSLYYLVFTLLGISCLCYLIQFRAAPLKVFLLVLFLAQLYWLQDFVRAVGVDLNSVTNSRVMAVFALVPATHIFLVLWEDTRPRAGTVAMVAIQSALLVFFLAIRNEVMWQVLVIFLRAGILVLAAAAAAVVSRRRDDWLPHWRRLWPAGILAALLLAGGLYKATAYDARYAEETKAHVFWHAVLGGILGHSPKLREIYSLGTDPNPDQMVYTIVVNDLNARGDLSSPIAYLHPQTRRIELELRRGSVHYERLVRAATLRVIVQHPFYVAAGLLSKLPGQVEAFTSYREFEARILIVPGLLIALAALACAVASGFSHAPATILHGAIAVAMFVVFASVTPAIYPTNAGVATFFTYVAAVVLAGCVGLGSAMPVALAWLRRARPAQPLS